VKHLCLVVSREEDEEAENTAEIIGKAASEEEDII